MSWLRGVKGEKKIIFSKIKVKLEFKDKIIQSIDKINNDNMKNATLKRDQKNITKILKKG